MVLSNRGRDPFARPNSEGIVRTPALAVRTVRHLLLSLCVIMSLTAGTFGHATTARGEHPPASPASISAASGNRPVTITLKPVADTYDTSDAPTSNGGGSSGALYVDKDPLKRAFLRFDLSALRGATIRFGTLKIKTTADASAGSVNAQVVKVATSNTWTEAGVNYNKTVPYKAKVVGNIPANTQPNQTYSTIIGSTVLQPSAGNTISFALEAMGGDGLSFFSRETSSAPQLEVTYLPRMYGVLLGENRYLASDWNVGIRLREVELNWGAYEPRDDQWDASYVTMKRTEFQQARDAGYRLVLDMGIQYAPPWARAIRPFRDQYGNTDNTYVNAIWSNTVRNKIEDYVQRLFRDFGTDFIGVRLGAGGWIETMYPDNARGAQWCYWAFDADAMGMNPVPHWRPGQASPNGEALTFYTWYVARLTDTVNWQQNLVRRYYGGYLLQLFTGLGVRPAGWEPLIRYNLKPTGQIGVDAASRGVAIDRIINGMTNRSNVVIYATGIADASATASWVDETSSDPMRWSSAHWIAYNADRWGMAKWAENAGHDKMPTMETTFKQMDRWGYSALFWAWNQQLYDGIHAPLGHYEYMIKRYR